MKTILPKSINSIEDANKLLRELFENNESFHPEDDAHDVIDVHTNKEIFTEEEADKLNDLIGQMYEIDGYDPCEYLLELTREANVVFLDTDQTE